MDSRPPTDASGPYGAAARLALGAAAGGVAWLGLREVLPSLPEFARFLLAWSVFTFGPGIAIGGRLTRGLDPLRRVVILLGIGSATTPLVIEGLGRLHWLGAFPFVTAALAGAGLALWNGPHASRRAAVSRADALGCAAILAMTIALGFVVFAHRYTQHQGGIQLYGDYDSADLSYYAAEATEAAHTVPPMASYYSGHQLNAAYYAQLVNGMIHRFGDVPIMSVYYHYAWPTFLSIGALTAFLLVRLLAPAGVAFLSVALILVGSDFSYLAAWFLPHAAVDWDYVLWPTNFFSSTMQVLHFSTWTPSLPVFFAALFAVVQGLLTRRRSWLVLSALLIALLFEFKPFAYIVLMGGLCAAAVFSGRDWTHRLHFAATVMLGSLFTIPLLIPIFHLDPSDRRSRLVIDFFMLPRRMLIKTDLTDAFMRAAGRLAPSPAWRTPILVTLATIVFLAIGVGIRWIGAAGVWRAVRRRADFEPDTAAWRLLGWCVITGVALPFVLVTDPYVDTLQFYLTGLYLLWIFTAMALVRMARARPVAGGLALGLAIVAVLPSSLHYLDRRWTDQQREPRASLTRSEVAIASYLRTCDPETTVILHDQPLSPSLIAVMAERRIVIGWDVKYSAVGGGDRVRDVDAFFSSAEGSAIAAWDTLRRYKVTHVIVREQSDRVHPDVLARLQVVLQFPDATLYAVPTQK